MQDNLPDWELDLLYGVKMSDWDDWGPNPNIVANPCNCEHPEHFPDMDAYDPNQHGYLEAPHDGRKALWVGDICNSCANGHYAQFVNKG